MKPDPARRIAACLLAALAMLSCIPAASAANLAKLRCEYRSDPLGIDVELGSVGSQPADGVAGIDELGGEAELDLAVAVDPIQIPKVDGYGHVASGGSRSDGGGTLPSVVGGAGVGSPTRPRKKDQSRYRRSRFSGVGNV